MTGIVLTLPELNNGYSASQFRTLVGFSSDPPSVNIRKQEKKGYIWALVYM